MNESEIKVLAVRLRLNSADKMAEFLGVHRNTANKYLRGHHPPYLITALRGELLARRVELEPFRVDDALFKYRTGE